MTISFAFFLTSCCLVPYIRAVWIQDKITELFQMAEQGNLSKLRQLLDRRALAMAKNDRGQSLLHVATLHSHMAIVEYLVHTYPDMVHAKDNVSLATDFLQLSLQRIYITSLRYSLVYSLALNAKFGSCWIADFWRLLFWFLRVVMAAIL